MTSLKTINWNGRDLIPTAGARVDNSGRLAGLFADEIDARSPEADSLACAIISFDSLSADQQAIAVANSEAL